MFFIVPTDKPIDVTCCKCGKKFTQNETRTCTSLNNFIHVCPKCKLKSILPFGKNSDKHNEHKKHNDRYDEYYNEDNYKD